MLVPSQKKLKKVRRGGQSSFESSPGATSKIRHFHEPRGTLPGTTLLQGMSPCAGSGVPLKHPQLTFNLANVCVCTRAKAPPPPRLSSHVDPRWWCQRLKSVQTYTCQPAEEEVPLWGSANDGDVGSLLELLEGKSLLLWKLSIFLPPCAWLLGWWLLVRPAVRGTGLFVSTLSNWLQQTLRREFKNRILYRSWNLLLTFKKSFLNHFYFKFLIFLQFLIDNFDLAQSHPHSPCFITRTITCVRLPSFPPLLQEEKPKRGKNWLFSPPEWKLMLSQIDVYYIRLFCPLCELLLLLLFFANVVTVHENQALMWEVGRKE